MKFVRPLLLTIFLIGGASLAVAQELTPVGHPENELRVFASLADAKALLD